MALYPVRSNTREQLTAAIRFQTAGAADPSAIVDPGGILSSISGPTTTGTTGLYRLNFKATYSQTMGVANSDNTAEYIANARNARPVSIDVITKQIDIGGGSVAGVDTTGDEVTVMLMLQR